MKADKVVVCDNPSEWAHHEEEGPPDGGQDVDGVGGDRLSSGTPGQRVEPRLADDIQVGAYVL